MSRSTVPIPGMATGQSLNAFHDDQVVPSRGEMESKNRTIDEFVRFLHTFAYSNFTVSEVHKSGSLGKGTAVRGCADIDLVVFLNDVRKMKKLKSSRPALLTALQQKIDGYPAWKRRVSFIKKTKFSLEYTLDGEKLDILPAFDVLNSVGGHVAVIYNNMSMYPMGTGEAAQQYSASLAPLQIAFVKPQNETVKRVIRLVKYWKTENDVDIRSYTLELIAIYAARTTMATSTDALFKKVMELLQSCATLKVAFGDHYESHTYTARLPAPYVLDPASPYMNTLDGKDPDEISGEARKTFKRL